MSAQFAALGKRAGAGGRLGLPERFGMMSRKEKKSGNSDKFVASGQKTHWFSSKSVKKLVGRKI